MKRGDPSRLILLTSLLGSSLSILAVVNSAIDANAQGACQNPPQLPEAFAWAQNQQVTVNIDPSYSQQQRDAIIAGFINWQNSAGNNSGVRFTFTSQSAPIAGRNPDNFFIWCSRFVSSKSPNSSRWCIARYYWRWNDRQRAHHCI